MFLFRIFRIFTQNFPFASLFNKNKNQFGNKSPILYFTQISDQLTNHWLSIKLKISINLFLNKYNEPIVAYNYNVYRKCNTCFKIN